MKKYMITNFLSLFIFFTSINVLYSQSAENDIQHVQVFHETGMFGGWPANHGIWIWENEILVGFSKAYYKYLGPNKHSRDPERPTVSMLARSRDGGETWEIENPEVNGEALKLNTPLRTCNEGINFKHTDFAMTAHTSDKDAGLSRIWYSYDRGNYWTGPCRLPNFGTLGTAARTDYIINNLHEVMLFITVAKDNGREGRPMVVRSTDGGKEWSFLSWIGPEPEGFSIMPASVRLTEEKILVTVRRREDSKRFISAYFSNNNGESWTYLNDPVDDLGEGNPPAMLKLRDGRIALTYAYRSNNGSRIGIKFSSDSGQTWSDEIVLRENDGANWDVGYPRMVQRSDGKLVIIYYWNHELLNNDNPYRYIAATIFDPYK